MVGPAPAAGLTKTEFAQHHGVSPRAVEHWLKAGCPSALERRGTREVRVFDLEDADPWVEAHREEAQGDRERVRAELDEAELRKRIAQAGKLEIDLAVKRGEVLRADEVEAGRLARIGGVKSALEALPAALAPRLVGRTEGEVREILAEEVRRVETEFAGGTT